LMMVSFENLIMLFVGIEILSISMYVLTGSDKDNLRSAEAALKYFLMGAFATGILLFGVALLYGATGGFGLSAIAAHVSGGIGVSPMLYLGLSMMLVGILFKLSIAPFHFWTPDVYDGAPSVFTAFMSTIVKTAGFAALFRLLSASFTDVYNFWWVSLAIATILTLIIGNITAVYQSSFKRMLAYSSISHAGYLLMAVTAFNDQSQKAVLFYSLAYALATITAFGVLIVVEQNASDKYEAFNGLGKRSPLLAFVNTVAMCSLAGMPLTAGFIGKLFIFVSVAENEMIWLLVIAVLMSAVGFYYYFRVIIAMYMRPANEAYVTDNTATVSGLYQSVLLLAAFLTLLLGIAPSLVTRFI
nr:NADH-quinone oxidoreductase subunit N [Cytophagales bacterium]